MNAIPMRERARPEFPAVVLTYSDLLQVLREEGPLDASSLADRTERIVSNIRRDQPKLRDAGVITFDGDKMVLTAKGERWLQGLDVAGGLADVAGVGGAAAADAAEGFVMLRHDELRPNPHNPRKRFDAEEIATLADTMAEGKGVLQNLLATATKLDGAHLLTAGERRWRAWGLLISDGRWTADVRLPVRLQDVDPANAAEALVMGLVENTQRSNLSWLEQARAYRDLIRETGWSARNAALRTGANPRVVQEMVKVLEEADPERIAAHERGEITAEQLRHSVREATPTVEESATERHAREMRERVWAGCEKLNAKQRCALVELADKVHFDPISEDRPRATKCGQHYPDPSRTVQPLVMEAGCGFGGNPSAAMIHADAIEWLKNKALYTGETVLVTDRWRLLDEVRQEAWGKNVAHELWGRTDRYATPWLNIETAPAAAKAEQTDIEQVAPAKPEPLALSPHEQLALVELQHAACEQGEPVDDSGQLAVPVHKQWLDTVASMLVSKRLLKFVMAGEPRRWRGYVTPEGEEWLIEHQLAERGGNDGAHVEAEHVALARDTARCHTDEGYCTEWLNAPTEIPAPPPEQASDHDGDDEPELPIEDDEAEAYYAATEALSAAKAAIAHYDAICDATVGPWIGREKLDQVFAKAERPLPFHVKDGDDPGEAGIVYAANGEVAFVCDPNGELPHQLAEAQARLICAFVNMGASWRPTRPVDASAEA